MTAPLKEYVIPICTISEDIIKTTEKPECIPPTLHAIGLQREMLVHLNRNTNKQHAITPIILEFVDQMLDTVFPSHSNRSQSSKPLPDTRRRSSPLGILPSLIRVFICTFYCIRLRPRLKEKHCVALNTILFHVVAALDDPVVTIDKL